MCDETLTTCNAFETMILIETHGKHNKCSKKKTSVWDPYYKYGCSRKFMLYLQSWRLHEKIFKTKKQQNSRTIKRSYNSQTFLLQWSNMQSVDVHEKWCWWRFAYSNSFVFALFYLECNKFVEFYLCLLFLHRCTLKTRETSCEIAVYEHWAVMHIQTKRQKIFTSFYIKSNKAIIAVNIKNGIHSI